MRGLAATRLLFVLCILSVLCALGVAGAGAADRATGARARPAATGPCDGDIAIGEIVTCKINSAGQAKDLTFPGANHDQMRIRVIKTVGTLTPLTQVKRQNGTVVCPDTTAAEITCVLDSNGTHTIHIRDLGGSGTGTFNVTIQRLNAPVGCVTAKAGQGKNGAINEAAEQDCFTMTGVAQGDVLRLRTAETSGTLFAGMEVLRPDGTTLCPNNGNTELTCTADVAGTYHFLVRDVNGTNTGTYTFWLQKLNGPAGCAAIAYGDGAHAGSIDGPAETDCYRFQGQNHDQARIRVTAGAGLTPLVEVVRPNGTTVCPATTSLDFTCTLDVNGTHTILVRDLGGTGTANYSVRVDKL